MMMKLSKGDSNGIVVEDTGVLSKVAGPQRSGQKKPLLATNTICEGETGRVGGDLKHLCGQQGEEHPKESSLYKDPVLGVIWLI